MGLGFVVMAIISLLILGSGAVAVAGIPQIEGTAAVVGTLISLVIVFLEGAIFGALVGWLYNTFQAEPSRRRDRDLFATP